MLTYIFHTRLSHTKLTFHVIIISVSLQTHLTPVNHGDSSICDKHMCTKYDRPMQQHAKKCSPNFSEIHELKLTKNYNGLHLPVFIQQ